MAELADALYALPTDRLRKIVENRQIPQARLKGIATKQQLSALIALELTQPAGVSRVLIMCDVRALRLLQIVISAERPSRVPWTHIVDQVGANIPEEALIQAMVRLEELGLAFRTPSGVVIPETVRHYTPTPLSDRTTIIRALSQYDPESVKRIAENLGLAAVPRATAVTAIRDELTSSRLSAMVARLDSEEARLLELLIHLGGNAQPTEVTEAGVGGSSEDFFRYDWQKRWRTGKPRNAIDRLLSIGLIYVVDHGYGYNLYLVIPSELMRYFAGSSTQSFWTSPEPAAEPISAKPEAVRRHTGVIRDAVAFLAFLSTQEAVRTSTGHIHKSSLKTVARALSIPSERYSAFVYAICRSAGLIDVSAGSLAYQVTPRGEAWLEWDSVDQALSLIDAWKRAVLWDEMFQEPLQKVNQRGQSHDTTVARSAAIRLLIEPAADSFVSVNSLAATIRFRLPLLMMEIGDDRAGDRILSPSDFVSVIGCESLYWLGLTEVASYSHGPGAAESPELLGVRLPPAMRYFLDPAGFARPEPQPRESQFVLQANAEVFVSPMLAPAVLFRVLSYSDSAAKGAATNTVVLSRDAIRRSFDRGETVREMLAFLQTHSRAGIPQNVEYLINEVGSRHGHIHIGKAQMYLQTDGPALMKELQARRELKPFFLRTLSDTVAILSADDADKVLRELRKVGYLPVSDDTPPKVANADRKRPPVRQGGATAAQVTARAAGPIDWDRIAADDHRVAPPDSGPPRGAAHERTMIRLLIQNVAKSGRPVQLAYRPADDAELFIREVIPTMVRGTSVLVMDTTSHEAVNLDLNRIQWARIVP